MKHLGLVSLFALALTASAFAGELSESPAWRRIRALETEQKITLPHADASWEYLSDGDDVIVHRKEVAGSDVVAFRGEAVLNAPIARVSSVLMDTPRKLEWVAKIVQAKDVRNIGPWERVEYNHTSSGFFAVRDRDFVFNAKASFDRDAKRVTFDLKSVDDPLMPETDKVRGSIDHGQYVLTSVSGDRQTHVTVEIHADPRGSVPKWLVNLFQKSWPRKTLAGIRSQIAKPDVLAHMPTDEALFAPVAVAGPREVMTEEGALDSAALKAVTGRVSGLHKKPVTQKGKTPAHR